MQRSGSRVTDTRQKGVNPRIRDPLCALPQIMQSQSTRRRLQAVLSGEGALVQQSGVTSTTAAAISAAIDTVNGFAGAASDTEAIETVSYVTQAKVRLHMHSQVIKALAAASKVHESCTTELPPQH